MAERRREWREGGRQAETRTYKKLEGTEIRHTHACTHTHTHTHRQMQGTETDLPSNTLPCEAEPTALTSFPQWSALGPAEAPQLEAAGHRQGRGPH